jgi:Lon protease-like protein
VIPLFPLPNAVVFPLMPLPLHVFEPRYRKLVADATAGEAVIGSILLRPGWEADYNGRPPLYDVGCAGRVERCEPLANGRYNIVLRGSVRFRIVEEHAGEPYRLARVEPIEDTLGDRHVLDAARKRVLEAIGTAADGPSVLVIEPELPHDVFVNALCQTLRLSPVEQQSLLDCNSTQTRYERLIEILDFQRIEEKFGSGNETLH